MGVCPICETAFEKSRATQLYCSRKCKSRRDNQAHYATHREYHKDKHDKYRKAHPEQMKGYAAKRRRLYKNDIANAFRRRHIERRDWILSIKAGLKCARCGESRPMCLDFHHLDGAAKEHNISTMIGKHHPKERILVEIAKCIVLCRNCHAVEHWEHGNHEYKSAE